jgi:ABC-type multidrug transport system fused ATPase/permease subunit
MNQILVELLKLANLFMIISRFIACTGRVGDVLAIPVGMDASREEGDRPGTKDEAPATADPGDGYLVFDDVSLTYEGAGSATLEHINLKVQKGQTIGVIGGTGSGKSSLVNLIPRFYDITEGSLRLEGQELKEMDPEALRKRIGMVPQKAVLFRGTIRSNLKWGNPDADDAAMWEALRLAQAEEIVRDKSGQLDATVAQGGKNFSGGQKQRLTIARALVRKPEILILDDSASALDYLTDRRLREAIASIKGITTFIVSQRASSVMNADQILVLDDGEPAGLGTHEELLKTCEVYREIYESQFEKGGETDELAE